MCPTGCALTHPPVGVDVLVGRAWKDAGTIPAPHGTLNLIITS